MIMQVNFEAWAAIGFVLALACATAAGALLLAHLVRPAKKGPVKDSVYESGMPVVGDARRRFNVRFYIVAMLFLLFDVEVVFLWPWAVVFYRSATENEVVTMPTGDAVGAGFMLVAMGIFFALLLVGFLYEWRKDAFQWD